MVPAKKKKVGQSATLLSESEPASQFTHENSIFAPSPTLLIIKKTGKTTSRLDKITIPSVPDAGCTNPANSDGVFITIGSDDVERVALILRSAFAIVIAN